MINYKASDDFAEFDLHGICDECDETVMYALNADTYQYCPECLELGSVTCLDIMSKLTGEDYE